MRATWGGLRGVTHGVVGSAARVCSMQRRSGGAELRSGSGCTHEHCGCMGHRGAGACMEVDVALPRYGPTSGAGRLVGRQRRLAAAVLAGVAYLRSSWHMSARCAKESS